MRITFAAIFFVAVMLLTLWCCLITHAASAYSAFHDGSLFDFEFDLAVFEENFPFTLPFPWMESLPDAPMEDGDWTDLASTYDNQQSHCPSRHPWVGKKERRSRFCLDKHPDVEIRPVGDEEDYMAPIEPNYEICPISDVGGDHSSPLNLRNFAMCDYGVESERVVVLPPNRYNLERCAPCTYRFVLAAPATRHPRLLIADHS